MVLSWGRGCQSKGDWSIVYAKTAARKLKDRS